jgi:di/tricarboxylate transporter
MDSFVGSAAYSDPLVVGLIVPIVVQTSLFYPVQLGTALVTYRTGHYTAPELLRVGLIQWIVGSTVIFAIALPWWSVLGEPWRA